MLTVWQQQPNDRALLQPLMEEALLFVGGINDAAIGILTGIIIAAVSAWITVRLSLKRFRSERWWEYKVEAYKRVIESLHQRKVFAEENFEAEIEYRELSEERDQDLRQGLRQARIEIEKATNTGAFFALQ